MENYFKVKFSIADILKQSLGEIEQMPFYEMEMLIEWLEEREKKKREDEAKQKGQTEMNQPSTSKIMRDAKNMMPSMKLPK